MKVKSYDEATGQYTVVDDYGEKELFLFHHFFILITSQVKKKKSITIYEKNYSNASDSVRTFSVGKDKTILIPRDGESVKFENGERVSAVYPESSTFYGAVVVGTTPDGV